MATRNVLTSLVGRTVRSASKPSSTPLPSPASWPYGHRFLRTGSPFNEHGIEKLWSDTEVHGESWNRQMAKLNALKAENGKYLRNLAKEHGTEKLWSDTEVHSDSWDRQMAKLNALKAKNGKYLRNLAKERGTENSKSWYGSAGGSENSESSWYGSAGGSENSEWWYHSAFDSEELESQDRLMAEKINAVKAQFVKGTIICFIVTGIYAGLSVGIGISLANFVWK